MALSQRLFYVYTKNNQEKVYLAFEIIINYLILKGLKLKGIFFLLLFKLAVISWLNSHNNKTQNDGKNCFQNYLPIYDI